MVIGATMKNNGSLFWVPAREIELCLFPLIEELFITLNST